MNVNSTPTPSWYVQIQHGLYADIYKTDERHVPFIRLSLILAISFLRTKAKNAFYKCEPFLQLASCKYTFFAEHDALFREFFYLYVRMDTKIRF